MNNVIISTFLGEHEANIAKSHCEAAGIVCTIRNATFLQANPLLAHAIGGYQLTCEQHEVKRARRILSANHSRKLTT